MTETALASPYESPDADRPCQGSIYRDVGIAHVTMKAGKPIDAMVSWEFGYAVALSQECDLEQDHRIRCSITAKARNAGQDEPKPPDCEALVLSVLMCPAYLEDLFTQGNHLSGLGRSAEPKSAKLMKRIRSNQVVRYHYISPFPSLQVPPLVIDFKHFFALPTELLRSTYRGSDHYIARLKCPFREHLSHRFAFFLSRIGLPNAPVAADETA